MTSPSPVRVRDVQVNGHLDPQLSRWLWMVKWLLLIPHFVVLAALWLAFAVSTAIAFFSILFLGRYPQSLFQFNLGVLRWTWRVGYYGYSALATDRYPPFTLRDVPDYPATLDIAYPHQLSRGLVLVKWWLLALPHYLILAFMVGGTSLVIGQGTSASRAWSVSLGSSGLLGVIVFFAAIALLFTRRYPQGLYDLALGFMRWFFRVLAYCTLMTDQYPPFRLDQGGQEPKTSASAISQVEMDDASDPNRTRRPSAAAPIVALIIGAVALLPALGLMVAGGAAGWLNSQRDASGFVSTGNHAVRTPTAVATAENLDIHFDRDQFAWAIPDEFGTIRIAATPGSGQPIFVGIAQQSDVDAWLAGIAHSHFSTIRNGNLVFDVVPGLPQAPRPAEQGFWEAQAVGTGRQSIQWPVHSGRWAVVIANADGSPGVNADVSIGARIPSLAGVAIVLILGGAMFGLIGLVLIVVAAVGLGRWVSADVH